MRYTAMIVGFLLATLTAVGAAESDRPDYVEFTVHDLVRTKTFYSAVFGWTFADYGPTYASFDDGKIGGGFTTDGTPKPGGPLMIFYVADIKSALQRVKAAGGEILKPPFAFPGGSRFHFREPDGYEIAAWSQK